MEARLKVENVNLTGQGVARDADGNVYFIPGAIPGDEVVARADADQGRYRDAELVEIVTPSPERVESVCATFKECGGCDWLDWDYNGQVRGKETMLRHVFERSAFAPGRFLPALRAKSPLGYRNRIQLRAEAGRMGFYRRRSHDIVDTESCPVAHPRINEALTELRSEGVAHPGRTKIELALEENGNVLRLENREHAAAGFAQVNDAQNALLRGTVVDLLNRAGSRSVLELYAGNGNFTFGYADGVEEFFAVDSSAEAIGLARKKWGDRSKPRAAFLEARVDARLARRLPREFRERYDTLLLDPPRSGTQECLGSFLHENLKTIVYVSCSPVAFMKDVQCLKEHFTFEQAQIVDMFPNTRHIEFVAWFSRSS